MSRKKEMREKRQADKLALEADFAARPAPKFPPPPLQTSSPRREFSLISNPLGFLQPRDWFDLEQIRFYKEFRAELGEPEVTARFAASLRLYGYVPSVPRDRSTDRDLVWAFEGELAAALWPRQVAKDIWGESDQLGPESVQRLIRFLEEDPYLHHSGYARPIAIKRLKQNAETVDAEGRRRITGIIERCVDAGFEIRSTDWLKLVPLADPDAVQEIIRKVLAGLRPGRRTRAIQLGLVLSGHTERLGFLYRTAPNTEWDRAERRVCNHFGWQIPETSDSIASSPSDLL